MSIQRRLIQSEGYAVLSGVAMSLKAALESGVDMLVASHLDSPDAYVELVAESRSMLDEQGVTCLTLPDARQGVASLVSGWRSGSRVMGLFDSEGVVDAAGMLLSQRYVDGDRDAGAMVLCYGPSDRDAGESATALLRRCGWLVIEPALQDEVKSFVLSGLSASAASGLPVAVALPESLLAGCATVACEANRYPGEGGEARLRERASENVDPMSAALVELRKAEVNAVVNPPGKDEDLPLTLVTMGRAFGWARQAMAELGLVGRVPILRLGLLTPLDRALVQRQAAGSRRVLMLDPTGLAVGRDVAALVAGGSADEQKRAAVASASLSAQAGPGGVIAALVPWLESHPTLPPELVKAGLARTRGAIGFYGDGSRGEGAGATSWLEPIAAHGENPPPGSSLVDVSVVLGRLRRDLGDAQYMLESHRSGPVDLAVFGELDDAARRLLSRSGELSGGMSSDGRLAGAAAAGASAVSADQTPRRSVVLMTSRRFFSLGSSAIADAVREGRSAVFVIHTEDPAEALGPRRRWRRRRKVNALDMQAMVEGIASGRRKPRPSVNTIDPSDRPRLSRLLERLLLSDGVHVVIARRKRGPRYYRKASEVHRKQSARRGYVGKQGCIVHCPEAGPLTARRRVELGVLGVEATRNSGDPWTTSVSWSWHDQTVVHALADPAIGLAVLERSQPERSRVVGEDLANLPDPARPIHANADAWRASIAGITGTAWGLTLDLLIEAGAAMGYLVRSTADARLPDGPTPRRADVLFTRRSPVDAPHVPAAPGRSTGPTLTAQPLPGHVDLVLGTELNASAQLAADPASPMDPAHTHALIDTLVIPDLSSLESGTLPDIEALCEIVQPGAQRDAEAATALLPIARLAEWLWGHQRYAAWVYLGYLLQRGWVPLTGSAIESAGRRVLGIADPRSTEAVRVGRKLAADPGYAKRMLRQDEPELSTLVRTLADDLAERAGSRRGPALGRAFQAEIEPLLKRLSVLDEPTRRRVMTIAQRCVYWAGVRNGPGYCQQFVQTLGRVLDIDSASQSYALTRAAIDGLERAMLIPDEVYLAALLTAPHRYRRDRRRLNLSLERGDRISYVHLLRPEFDVFKRRVGFTVTLGERALKAVARLHVLRRVRPGWYRTQRDFRDFYIEVLGDLKKPESDSAYRAALDRVGTTSVIAGRGDNRRATVLAARRALEKLLQSEES